MDGKLSLNDVTSDWIKRVGLTCLQLLAVDSPQLEGAEGEEKDLAKRGVLDMSTHLEDDDYSCVNFFFYYKSNNPFSTIS